MGRRICALPQDQNFPLTHARSPFPRISSSLLLFDEHAGQIFAMTDEIAERARKIGGQTLRSIGDIARHQTVLSRTGSTKQSAAPNAKRAQRLALNISSFK